MHSQTTESSSFLLMGQAVVEQVSSLHFDPSRQRGQLRVWEMGWGMGVALRRRRGLSE